MTLADIPRSSAVFVDANILISHFAGRSDDCSDCLARIEARRPDLVRQLSRYHFSVAKIPQMGIEVLPFPDDCLGRSQEYRQVQGLLVNDSLITLQIREAGVTLLASGDAAFDRIPWIRRAAPRDV